MDGPRSLIEHFSSVEDPRIDRTKKHQLIDIIVMTVSRKINPLFDLFRLTPALFQFAASGLICSILMRFEAEECRNCLFFRFSRKLFFVKASISWVLSKAPP
jgi:hypothetical protein